MSWLVVGAELLAFYAIALVVVAGVGWLCMRVLELFR
jgi:hypothetical protein